jgi:ribose transport system substrate-binding protein
MRGKKLGRVIGTAGATAAMALLLAGTGMSAAAAPPIHKATPPKDIRGAYAHSALAITTSAYADWKREKGKFVVGFANGTMGPTWRSQDLADLHYMFNVFRKKGIVSSLIVDNANNDVSTQISQINDLIAQKVNVILINPVSETGTNPVIQKAYDAGIPVISFNNFVSSPYAENVGINQSIFAIDMAQGLVNLLHGKGNIVMMEGIPGQPDSTIREAAAKSVFAKYPGIHIIANVSGNFSDAEAKTAMLNVLTTHPQSIQGVWQSGVMADGIRQAIAESGRPMVPITASGQYNFVNWWHAHPTYKTVGAMDVPASSTLALRVAIRILEGQHPLLNVIFHDPPLLGEAQMKADFRPGQAPTAWVDLPPYKDMSHAELSKYFSSGK